MMRKTVYACFAVLLAFFAGCSTTQPAPVVESQPPAPLPPPPPPPPPPTVVYMGAQDKDPLSEEICGSVAHHVARRGGLLVSRRAESPKANAAVFFGFKADEKARLDNWYVYTGTLSLRAVVYGPTVGEVLLAETTFKIDGERGLGRDAAIKTLVKPMQAAADKWVRENVTESKIKDLSK